MFMQPIANDVLATFQCSSASRKFLNFRRPGAKNRRTPEFQCSSASRKFLNSNIWQAIDSGRTSFSALQRAENSSMIFAASTKEMRRSFSALQRAENSSISPGGGKRRIILHVSVLFSEPKIPQSILVLDRLVGEVSFQCSSASRKFLNADPRTCVHPYSRLRRSRFVVPEPSWCVAMTPVY